ncbi:NAD-dependent epimerase/dehydratase family protein [Cellulosimicrobium sp. PMB13]|uniref:NAD-dependent epimerase/dehydratase family protein n=1 Tax=Cellulosimicrobium sp. PMB13 TaxID=3120158 RepID=UPI003F4BF10C
MSEASHTRRAVIVGARGFIGRALARKLVADGYEVSDVTRSFPLEPGTSTWSAAAHDSTIYWCASTINPQIAERHPELVHSDRMAFRDLLTGLRAEGSTSRVVLLSSGGTVYGDAGAPPFTESVTVRPTTAYGRAKAVLEEDLHELAPPGSVAVRVSNAYGPGQRTAPGQGVLGHWLRAVAAGRTVHVFGDLRSVRDYVFIDDLVDGLARLHAAPALPAVLNLGSGVPTTLAEVLAVVREVAGEQVPQVEIDPARSFDADRVWLDVSAAREAVGWIPSTPLATGTKAMWEWILDGERDE